MAHLATDRLPPCQRCGGPAQRSGEERSLPGFRRDSGPSKFTNVTNGVTPRRWVALANPQLDRLLARRLGHDWAARPDAWRQLERFQNDASFMERWAACKLACKRRLAHSIHRQQSGLMVDPTTLFDVQVKRIHEYKRQHLNALQVVAQYLRIKNGLAARAWCPAR